MSACAAPFPLGTLADYWLGELPPAEAEAAEAHVFGCADCTARTAWLAALADGVRGLVRCGALSLVLTPALLARLEADGVRIRRHRVAPGGRTRCTAGPDDDLVAVSLSGNFPPGERVDLIFRDAPPGIAERIEDVPVDRAAGLVTWVEPGDVIRPLPAHVAVVRLHGVSAAGERTIGEYTLDHTPWPGTAPG